MIVRAAYIDSLIALTSDEAQIKKLEEIKRLASVFAALRAGSAEKFALYRLQSGEDPKKVKVPRFAEKMSEEGERNLNKTMERLIKRLTFPAPFLAHVLPLLDQDIKFWQDSLKYINLPQSLALQQEINAAEVILRDAIAAFLEAHPAP
jgi:hypothetical protein